MPKINFWLIGAVCLLVGIIHGICIAPMTHGIAFGCNNGNTSNCTFGTPEDKKEKGIADKGQNRR